MHAKNDKAYEPYLARKIPAENEPTDPRQNRSAKFKLERNPMRWQPNSMSEVVISVSIAEYDIPSVRKQVNVSYGVVSLVR